MGMKLAFSKGGADMKGSPYVEFDDTNRFIFSMTTSTEKGIKYLIYSNQSLNGGRQRENLSFITTMRMKGTSESPTLGLPNYFKRNPYYQNGTVDALKEMIGKYLDENDIFPFSAFPKLAEDIVKWNDENPDLTGTVEVSETKRLSKVRKPRKPRMVKPETSEEVSDEKPVKKERKPRSDKGKKRGKSKSKKVKKTRKTRSDKGKKRGEKKVKKNKVVKTKKSVKNPKASMKKAARGRRTKRGRK